VQTQLLDPASFKFPRVETLMIESTYGSKLSVKEPEKEADDKLAELIAQTVQRGGKILMPVLGTGRAQNVLVILDKLAKDGRINVPVFIDGMVWEMTAIHTAYPEYMNLAMRKKLASRDTNPFLNPLFKRVGSSKERKQIIDDEGPCVILATSGMLVGGASVEYFKGLAENPKNMIVFSSYLGSTTLGARVFRGDKELSFSNGQKQETLKVNMEISKIDVSGHADRNGLMTFVSKCEPRPKKIIVNHGEPGSALDLASSIHKDFRIETVAPKNLDAIRLR